MLFIEDFVSPLGRGRKFRAKLKECQLSSETLYFGCKDMGTIAVRPDGSITACCGHIFSSKALDALTIGNVDENLNTAIRRLQRNVLYWWIALKGSYDILKRLNPTESACHRCEACHILLTKYKNELISLSHQKEKIFDSLINHKEVDLSWNTSSR